MTQAMFAVTAAAVPPDGSLLVVVPVLVIAADGGEVLAMQELPRPAQAHQGQFVCCLSLHGDEEASTSTNGLCFTAVVCSTPRA